MTMTSTWLVQSSRVQASVLAPRGMRMEVVFRRFSAPSFSLILFFFSFFFFPLLAHTMPPLDNVVFPLMYTTASLSVFGTLGTLLACHAIQRNSEASSFPLKIVVYMTIFQLASSLSWFLNIPDPLPFICITGAVFSVRWLFRCWTPYPLIFNIARLSPSSGALCRPAAWPSIITTWSRGERR